MSFTREEMKNLQSGNFLPEFMRPVLTELEAAYRSRRKYKSSWDAVFSDEITEPMDKLKNLLNREQNKTGQICFRLMEESIFQIDADLWLNTLALLLYKNENSKN